MGLLICYAAALCRPRRTQGSSWRSEGSYDSGLCGGGLSSLTEEGSGEGTPTPRRVAVTLTVSKLVQGYIKASGPLNSSHQSWCGSHWEASPGDPLTPEARVRPCRDFSALLPPAWPQLLAERQGHPPRHSATSLGPQVTSREGAGLGLWWW